MTTPPTTTTEPTGLDFHAAFRAMYPGLANTTVRIHEINDAALKVVTRAARLRREERERVKAKFLKLAEHVESGVFGVSDQARTIADQIRKTAEEIR